MKKRGCTPQDNKPIIIYNVQPTAAEKMELEVKPLVVPDKIPNVQPEFGGTCAVSMEQLTLRPASKKCPTACRGQPFKPYNAPSQKRMVHKIEESDAEKKAVVNVTGIKIDEENSMECEGDAKIQLASGSYNEWLAGQGLLMLSETEDRYNLQIKVEDISDADDDGNENKQDEKLNSDVKIDENVKTDPQMDKNVKNDVKMDENVKTDVRKDEYIKSCGNECNYDGIAEEV